MGSDVIQDLSDESQYEELKAKVMAVVSQHFKPEFLNRIDESVVFHPLDASQIKKIAKIQIKQLAARLAERNLTLEISADALDVVASVGFDPVYGARPLKRAIQQLIENPLAEYILAGKAADGATLIIEQDNGQLFVK